MKPNARKFVAACALLALGAIALVTVGGGAVVSPPKTAVKGHVRPIRIKHTDDKAIEFALDAPSDKYVTINTASTVFWHFTQCEANVDYALIRFDSTHGSPFDAGKQYKFTAADQGIEGGNVIVKSSPRDTFRYRLTIYLKGGKPPVEVDPGIIIDDVMHFDSTGSMH